MKLSTDNFYHLTPISIRYIGLEALNREHAFNDSEQAEDAHLASSSIASAMT